MKVVTRFPPSPTGYFHIGSARTALFNYLFAAHEGGVMRMRFEDTDKERSKREFEDDILEGMKWLGIPYELPAVYRQSERTDVYQGHLKRLIESGAAYEAEEAKDSEGKVIRFKNPNVQVHFTDLIRGDVKFDTTELADFVIAKNISEPLYHLAVVIDDYEMGVTHVIRGEDHVSNTQRQILILEALGFTRPLYAHLPLILNKDKSKFSKRHGAVSVNEYRAQGFLPEAIINYLALLGWNPGTDKELFSLKELAKEFHIEKVQKSGAVFDMEKLRWFNREYLLKLPEDQFAAEMVNRLKIVADARNFSWNDSVAHSLVPILRERVHVWDDVRILGEAGELDYFFADPNLEPGKIPGKGGDAKSAATHLEAISGFLGALSEEDYKSPDVIKEALWEYATKEGRGAVLWPFRYVLTGQERSPDPFSVSSVIGRETALRRIDSAVKELHKI